jgi:glycosyltransferase involved in cell wall biosynthesis
MAGENRKKRILILVDWFVPGYKAGGPIQSCLNVALALQKDFEIFVLTTDTDHGESEPYKDIESNKWIKFPDTAINVFYLKKATLKPSQIKEQIEAVDAEYVYLNHMFSPKFVLYPLWLKLKNKLKAKILLCPRGALYESALSVKPYKKRPVISLFRGLGMHKMITFHATNEREKEAILSYFPGSKVLIADNLPKLSQHPFTSIEKTSNSIKCIFIARIVPIKNLLFLLNVLDLIKKDIQLKLTVIGPVEDLPYWGLCEKKIAQLAPNLEVEYLGAKPNSELANYIREHHLFILPTTGENFGHSIFEAMFEGRPVLISDQTPWLNLAQKNAGWDLPLNNDGAFAEVIEKVATFDQNNFEVWAKGAWTYGSNYINNSDLQKRYLQMFS